MNFMVMIKVTKASEEDGVEDMQANESNNTFDHRLLSQNQEYDLEASIDILKLYDTLNDLELKGVNSASSYERGHNSSRLGYYAAGGGHSHSPTIIFPDDLPHPSALMPNTDGGSVSSYLSPLSNTNISAFATDSTGGEGGAGAQSGVVSTQV
jgi:hypothetical protein